MDNSRDIDRILIGAEEIQKKVAELGQKITEDYLGKDLLVVGILKGAIIFLSDLVRHINIPLTLDFVAVTSYGTSTSSSGVVRILKDLDTPVEGRHVLIVEDIVDTGLTLRYLVRTLQARRPASIRTCTFLDKPSRRTVKMHPDYNGFEIPDVFVVGYGLDYAEKYRHLPFLAVLKPEVYK
ncbi:MAG: hypoxanthine phosphoribosyltransferase [Clostridia bacterium]|nr:hypoxanthine phosphoribosyltransferase [Clostridia bacterium]